MAQFHVTFGHGGELEIEADAIDNVPEFVRELKTSGYVSGRRPSGEAIALIDPHIATVEMV